MKWLYNDLLGYLPGYYLDFAQDNHDIKIFYKCYLSCSLCDKGKEYSIETNQDIHNCLKCKENFYPLKNDNNPNNCYNEEEMLPKGYNLVRNYWTICHENCEVCIDKPEYDLNNVIIKQNCLSCYDNLHLIYDTSDCTNDSILSKGYYFNDIDSMYHKCDIQCKTCDKFSTSLNPNCTSCNNDLGYYLAIDKPSSNCYNQTTIGEQYKLSEIENDITGEIIKQWALCYKTCKTCNTFGNELEHDCIICISNYYLIFGTSNCINNKYANENGFYFNTTYNQYTKCDKACISYSSGFDGHNTNCIKCNEEMGYFPLRGKNRENCYNNQTIEEGYFLNKIKEPYQWEECYENCATCEYKGNAQNMACLSCKTNLIDRNNNKPIYLKYSNGNCNIGCPNNLFLTKELDCLPSCLNGTYEFTPNYTCLDTCPEHYEINEERTRCVYSTFEGITSIDDFKDIIFKNITSFIDSSTVINGTHFIAQIIAASDVDPVEQIQNGISGLDFGDCIEILKDVYNISDNEDLIVIEIETKEDKEKNKLLDKTKDCIDLGKNVKVSICDFSGNILDMSYCNNEIIVMKYIGAKTF